MSTDTTSATISGTIQPLGFIVRAGAQRAAAAPALAADPTASVSVTVTVTDAKGRSSSVTFSITVTFPALAISTTTLPGGTAGTAYSASVTASGGIAPYSWTITGLPAGLTSTSGTPSPTISGTTNNAGTFSVTATVTDSESPVAMASVTLSLVIAQAAPLTISTTSLPNGTVGTAYSQTLASSGGAAPIIWSISSGALPSWASLNASTGAITGTPDAAATTSFTVKATDSTSPTPQTATQVLSITVTVAPLMITTTKLPNGIVGTAYHHTLQFSGGTLPVTWSISSGSLPTWATLNASTGAITGTPTVTGTTSFTVKATDSATPTPQTATQALSITINTTACLTGGSESLLTGGYAFLLKGFDSSGNPALVGGVLTFNGVDNNGLITAGAMDMNLAAGPSLNLTVTSGTYGVGSDHRGCMVITTSAGTQNYRFSLGNISSGVASTGHMIDFDSTTTGLPGPYTTGVLRKQTGGPFTNSQVTGTFAFGGSSIQNAAECINLICGGKFAVAGVITFNGTGGITGGSEDINQNGILDGNPSNTPWPASPISFNSTGSSYTIAPNGRGTVTIAFIGATLISHNVLFVVSSSEAFFMNIDPQATTGISAGEAFLQSGGPFTNSSMSGTYVGYSSGLGNAAGMTSADVYLVNVSNPNITGTDTRNDGGAFASGSIHTPTTYAVASSGRTVTTGGNHPALLYIVDSNRAFFLASNGRVDSGFFETQSVGPFTNSSASGAYAYGGLNPADPTAPDFSGIANFVAPNLSFTEDDNLSGSLVPDGTASVMYLIDSTGLGLIPSGCTISATSTTCGTIFYVISPTKTVFLDVGTNIGTTPVVFVADQ